MAHTWFVPSDTPFNMNILDRGEELNGCTADEGNIAVLFGSDSSGVVLEATREAWFDALNDLSERIQKFEV